ncbi:NADase-type glycan-binding domain-containing protein [Leptospira neocaledonica]|uniref:NAD glycohydrolase translocation F5/8 type C domain-containing protein n=1 Tax=Leptospira neocaledonica TaxID=2023192 RepID=A0A2M9ZZC3_9LEPT|nr:hypothetical protein [Leptospira neocaledonica]PJZ77397.1 hypothetical protein CH365_07350 [Leptospira neocaledonica]
MEIFAYFKEYLIINGVVMKRLLNIKIILICLIFQSYGMKSQSYELSPCTNQGDRSIISKLKNGEIISSLEGGGKPGNFKYWSTSLLKAAGTPPKIKKDDLGYGRIDYEKWSCQYSAYSANDKNTKTAWSEGVSGDGIGEIIIVQIDIDKPVKIWSGFGKSKELFYANNRPKEIEVYVLQAGVAAASQCCPVVYDIYRIGKGKVSLKDLNGYQDLPIPKFEYLNDSEGGVKTSHTFLAIEILSVYKGTKYQDTLITEVSN